MHEEADKMLKKAGLSNEVCRDLADMYLDDCEEYSVATALEKLAQGIEDAKAPGDAVA